MSVVKKPMNEITIALGSNIEPRFQQLKTAVKYIKERIGNISQFSKVYETPAWGFVSTPFLNACIIVSTKFSTLEVLAKLQGIENEIGRKPKKGKAYEARPIDLDIIYSSEGVFNTPTLVVPHPLLQDRKFVLVPLQDVSPYTRHPLMHVNTIQLLKECKDNSEIKPIVEKLR